MQLLMCEYFICIFKIYIWDHKIKFQVDDVSLSYD